MPWIRSAAEGWLQEGQGDPLAHVLDLARKAGALHLAPAAGEPAGRGPGDEEEGREGRGEGRALESEPGPPTALLPGRPPLRLEAVLVALEHRVKAVAESAARLLLGQDAELGPDDGQVLEVLPAGGAGEDVLLDVPAAGLVEVPGQIIGELLLGLVAGHDFSPWSSR